MNDLEMKHLLEAALLAAGRPITTQQLAELYDERERPSHEQIVNALQALTQDYEGRGLQLLEVASGWRIQIRNQCVDFVSRLWQERPSRYSRALLETLALIAYRQPITRGEIEEIRGVAVSATMMRTLHERNWIRVVGHREVPGRPEVLATTKEFLDYFGLKSLDDLPSLAELKDVETVGVQLEFNTGDALVAANSDAASANESEQSEQGQSDWAAEQTNTESTEEAPNDSTSHSEDNSSAETEAVVTDEDAAETDAEPDSHAH